MPQLHTTEGFMEMPHRADVALKVWSKDLTGLFIQAARGLYCLMGFGKSQGCNISRSMSLSESDYEMLLIRFLNELIFDVQHGSVIYEELNIEIRHIHLFGELKGKKSSGFMREIKAATYHECKIIQTAAGYETMIVFDI